MRIRDQLLLAMASAIAVAVIVLGSLAYVTERSAGNLLSQRDGQEIARDVANLLTLTQEYTVYGGARATGQWHAWHGQLRQTVERALAREPEPHPALVEMRQRVLDLLPLYEGLEGAFRDAGAELGPRRRELMVERLVSEMQELVDARHRWATAIIEQQAREQRAANAIVLVSAVVLLVLVTGLVLVVRRRGLVPLERLRAAAAAIQQGDLSVRCDASARDELGDTGRAVNAMAESLLTVNAALRESQERYQLAVAGSDDGVFDWDYRTGQAFGSARARELLGLQPGPEMQSTAEWIAAVEAHLHPDDVPRRRAAIDAHMTGRAPTYEGEFRVRHADGSYRWVRIRGLCIGAAGGTPHRMAGSISDIDARRRAEESLRQSEERFALAVAGTDDGILDWDIDNDRMYTSERAMEIVGLPPGLTTRSRSEWVALLKVHPDDRVRHDDAIRRNLAGETAVRDEEHRLLQPDGTWRWVRVRGTCVRDATGRATRWVGSVSDIDARKRAEEALRLSEERYAIAMTGSDEAHWVWDVKTDELFASSQLRQLTGVAHTSATPVTRTEWLAGLPMFPADRQAVQKAVDDHLAGLTPRMEVEYRLLDPAGGPPRWLHTRGQCFRDADGKPERVAGATVDITQRKRAEEALRESEARYQLAAEGANQGLWDWDLETDILFASPRFQELMGLAASDQLRPRREWIASVTFHPDDIDGARAAMAAHLRGETRYFEAEFRMKHHAGDWHWYRQRGAALRDEQGRPYRVAGSMEDTTEQKKAEAERLRLESQLLQAKKLEAIGTLAGGIAHDFNNILAAILGNGEMAQSEAPAGSPLRRHVDAVVSAGTRAKSLVERILAFSRAGIGERVPVHVQSVVEEALGLVATSLPARVRLERHLAGGDACVLGDPTQIHQVVMNLCTNGVQAIKAQGALSVALDVAERSAAIAATSAMSSGRYVRLRVTDTGMGIAANALERIFDPFFTTKGVGVGTGLGLSLVHGIVTDLGGGIDVDSTVGQGTTFTVYLPLAGAHAVPADSETSVANGDGETILLVDDEEPLVRLGEEMLARLGYEPVGFTSSAAALEAFRAAPDRFHAVLSDQAMPDVDGIELAREIRAIRPAVPIVLMSGFVSAALLTHAQGIGIAEVIAKPLVGRDIARCLADALGRVSVVQPRAM